MIYHDQWYYEADFNEESSQDTRVCVQQERVDLLLNNGRGTCKVGLWWLFGTVSDIFSYIEPDYVLLPPIVTVTVAQYCHSTTFWPQ